MVRKTGDALSKALCVRADLKVAFLGSLFQEEQRRVGHAKCQNNFIRMYMIPRLHSQICSLGHKAVYKKSNTSFETVKAMFPLSLL